MFKSYNPRFVEHISQAQQEQAPGKWQQCRRRVNQEFQVFSRVYRDVHKKDQWGTIRQTAASAATGILIGCSIAVPLYCICKGIHGQTIDSDITSSVETGGIGGALLTTYKIMLSPVIRRWNSIPRPRKSTT